MEAKRNKTENNKQTSTARAESTIIIKCRSDIQSKGCRCKGKTPQLN